MRRIGWKKRRESGHQNVLVNKKAELYKLQSYPRR